MDQAARIDAFKTLLAPPGLPELGPGPRPGVLTSKELDDALKPLLVGSSVPPASRDVVRGLLLLWHDHFEPAHAIAQDIASADGSLLHAILHRREPDYSNAAYWFRRVGRHGSFPALGARVSARLESKGESALAGRLAPGGEWEPFAFIRLCERSNADDAQLLREIQGVETEVLLEYWLG